MIPSLRQRNATSQLEYQKDKICESKQSNVIFSPEEKAMCFPACFISHFQTHTVYMKCSYATHMGQQRKVGCFTRIIRIFQTQWYHKLKRKSIKTIIVLKALATSVIIVEGCCPWTQLWRSSASVICSPLWLKVRTCMAKDHKFLEARNRLFPQC